LVGGGLGGAVVAAFGARPPRCGQQGREMGTHNNERWREGQALGN